MGTLEKESLQIDIEYCRVCDYGSHCLKLANQLKQISENIDVRCISGRRGSFEVHINDTLVYSKLQTMALPDFNEVSKNVKKAQETGVIEQVKGQQLINCVIS